MIPTRKPPPVMYDIKPILKALPGRSYLGFSCEACRKPIAMLNDSGVGGSRVPPSAFEVICPHCGTGRQYHTADLAPFTA